MRGSPRLLLLAVGLLGGCGGGERATPADPCAADADVRFSPHDGVGAKDFSLIHDGRRYHIFHIRENGPWMGRRVERRLGHEVSEDLVTWSALPPVDLRGEDGTWRDRHVWAPHVLRRDGRWWLYYTGVTYDRDPPRNLQRIGLARSDDLLHWEQVPSTVSGVEGSGCVLEGRAPWTAWGSEEPWSGDCRDPFVVGHDGSWTMLLSVRLPDRRMAVARAASEDGLRWRLLEPIAITRGRRAESPGLVRAGGTWHLLWSGGSGVQHATAPSLEGPWTPQGVLTGGFAPDLLPVDDHRALYGWVDGAFRVRLRALRWEGMEISGVVSPRCPDAPRPQRPLPRYGSSQESAGP